MSKKLCTFLSAVIGGVSAVAIATVTYFAPPYAVAINSAIAIASAAATDIMAQFVKPDEQKK